MKQDIPELTFVDSHINTVCKDYYKGERFCRSAGGGVSLWKLYNLFAAANKNSYIDSFLEQAVNAAQFAQELANALAYKNNNWFLG